MTVRSRPTLMLVVQSLPDTAMDRPGNSPGNYAGRPVTLDPFRARALFPEKWSAFLHAHFPSAAYVGLFFGVDERAARHWWEATGGPQGWAVDYVSAVIPGARQWLDAA